MNDLLVYVRKYLVSQVTILRNNCLTLIAMACKVTIIGCVVPVSPCIISFCQVGGKKLEFMLAQRYHFTNFRLQGIYDTVDNSLLDSYLTCS